MTGEHAAPTSVVLVEDDEDTRELTALVLCRRGYAIRVAGSVQEACTLVDAWAPDVLICDLALPDGSGLDVARHAMREGGSHPRLLIALTGHVQPEDRARSRATGFHHHLAKPFATADLCALIERHVPRG